MRARHLDDPYRRKRERMTRWLQAREISRRQVLQRAGVALVAAGWAPSLQAAEAPKAGGVINFMSWEGYDFPEQMADWKKANGVEVQATYMGSHDDIQAKILGGGGEGLDLITYGSSLQTALQRAEDPDADRRDKIPNLPNLLPFFESDAQDIWVDPDGTRTGVPADWGAVGISYDSAMITEAPTLIRHHCSTRSTRARSACPTTRSALTARRPTCSGSNSSRMTEDDFTTVTNWLKDLAKQTKGIVAAYGDVSTRFIAGDIVLSLPRLGGLQVVRRGGRQEHHRNGVAANGGGLSFSNAWAIPPGADNVDTVYAWINETLEPEVNAADGQVSGRRGGGGGRRGPARPESPRRSIRTTSSTNSLRSRRCSRTRRSNPISSSPVSASWRHGRR